MPLAVGQRSETDARTHRRAKPMARIRELGWRAADQVLELVNQVRLIPEATLHGQARQVSRPEE